MKKPDAKAPLVSGGRLAALEEKMEDEGKSPESAKKIAASVGWKKYGKKMGKMAAAGKK